MPRHLTTEQIESALNRGESVEQFLGAFSEGFIAWLEIRPFREGFELWRFETFDDGNEQFLDVHSFSPVEGEWPVEPVGSHDSLATALQTAEHDHMATSNRWVNQGLVQDEYGDYLSTKS